MRHRREGILHAAVHAVRTLGGVAPAMNLPHYRCDIRQQHNAHNWPRSGVSDAYCAGRGEQMPEVPKQPNPGCMLQNEIHAPHSWWGLEEEEIQLCPGIPDPGLEETLHEGNQPVDVGAFRLEMDIPLEDPNAKALLGEQKWEDPDVKHLMGAISADDVGEPPEENRKRKPEHPVTPEEWDARAKQARDRARNRRENRQPTREECEREGVLYFEPVAGQTGTPNTSVQRWADRAMFKAEPIDADEGPKVYLLWMTPDPLGAIAAACKMYKGEVVRDLSTVTDAERLEYFREVQKTKLQAPF